jgi:ATP synthase F1 gamma subunit
MEEKQIKRLLDELKLLGEVSLAFSQISSTRMKRIREEVLSSRDFQSSIYDIFKEVLASYAAQFKGRRGAARSAKGEKITFLSHNGKTVALFISANTGLYGDIVNRTFELFATDVRKGNVEVCIIGKLGLSMFQDAFPHVPYTYFDLADYGKDIKNLAKIISHIVQYERVQIYYGRYDNVVRQTPAKYDISAEVPIEGEVGREITKYIFEPTLPEILGFFESELFTTLFDHSVYEAQLAKFASRMIAMDAAAQKIEDNIKETSMLALRASHSTLNRKQQNSLVGIFYLETHG